ncbi:MAG: hypothetical protein EXS14_03715 [Planctomycetes bacterium]|nr:hypothetical protein [Planctomycetota bacterium]
MDMGKFVDRRLHAVRVAVNLLNHEMETSRNEGSVTLDREQLKSIIETFGMFVEDFDVSWRAVREQNQKKFAQVGAAQPKVG